MKAVLLKRAVPRRSALQHLTSGVWNWLEKFHSNSHVIIFEVFALSMCQTRCGYQVPTFQNAKKWWVSSPVRKKQKMKVLLGCTLKNMMIIWWLYIYDIMMHYCCNKAKEVQPHSSFGIFPEVAVSKKSVDCRVSDAWMCKSVFLVERERNAYWSHRGRGRGGRWWSWNRNLATFLFVAVGSVNRNESEWK